MQPMSVLFMADVKPEPYSGASGSEIETISELRKLGCQVDEVWAGDLSHRITHGNLHHLIELPVSYRSAMLRKLDVKRYDVVHVNQSHGYLAARMIHERFTGSVFIHRSHGFESRVFRDLSKWRELHENRKLNHPHAVTSSILSKLLRRHYAQIARYADGHIVSASQCRDFLVTEFGVDNKRVAVIPQSPPDYYKRMDGPFCAKRLSRILYVGQFAFVKAPMILGRVFSDLAKMRNDISITWVCAKRHHDEARLLLDPSIRARVRFLDWMPREKLREIYDEHGIFLFPSFFEGFGKSLLEAMSRGLCVIASDNGGMRDVILNNVSGLKVPTGDSGAMVASCLELLDDPNRAAKISSRAIGAANQYGWDRVGGETLNFYKAVIRAKLTKLKTSGIT